MAASERLSLLLESRTVGEQDVDRLEKAINRVLSTAERSKAGTDRVAASTGNFSQSLEKLNQISGGALNTVTSFTSRLEGISSVSGLATAGILATGAALIGLTAKMASAAEQSYNSSIRLGTTVKQYELLAAVSEDAGLNSEALQAITRTLSQALTENSEEGKKAKDGLKALGVEARDSAGRLKPTYDILLEISDALQGLGQPERQTALSKVFGRGAVEFMPAFAQNLRQAVDEMERSGRVMDDVGNARLRSFDDRIDSTTRTVKGLAGALAEASVNAIDLSIALAKDFFNPTGPSNIENYYRDRAEDIRRREFGEFGPGASENRRAGNAAQAAARSEFRSGQSRLARFLASGNPNDRLQTAEKNLQDAIAKAGESITIEEEKQLNILRQKVETAKAYLEQYQKQVALQKQLAEFVFKEQPNTINPRTRGLAVPTLRRPGIQGFQRERFTVNELNGVGAFIASDADIAAANGGATQARMAQLRALVEGTAKAEQDRVDRQQQAMRVELDHRVRMIQLLAGPGGEVAAIQRIYELRIKGAQTELEKQEAINQREESIAELRKRQRDDFREGSGRLFDAAMNGPAGIAQFGLNFFSTAGRTVTQNISSLLFDQFQGKLSLPGQAKDGQLTTFGKILQGTPFGIDPLKISTDANTAATIANTQALLTRAGFGPGAASSILSGIPGMVFGGSTGNPFVFSATGNQPWTPDSIKNDPLLKQAAEGRGLTGIDLGIGIPGLNLTQGSKYASLYKGLGIAGAVAGGGYGIYRGVQEGGAQGALTATSSAAGMGAALLPLLGVAGPLAPILGFASLGIMGLKALLGDPRQKRDRAISQTLDNARYEEPSSINYEVDEYGRGVDYNRRGRMRPVIIINQNIDNLDAKSLIDRGPDIAEATRQAVEKGHAAALTEMFQQQGKPY